MLQGAAGLVSNIKDVMPEVIHSGLFVSLCTVQQPSGTFTASGFPDGLFTDISGVVNVPCMRAPLTMLRVGANEQKEVPGVKSTEPVHILLNAYFPQIPQVTTTRPSLRAVVDGVDYEVMGVEHDSQLQMTRLLARVASR